VKTLRTFPDAENDLRLAGIALPEVTEDFPWGHRALKVGRRIFMVIALEHDTIRVSFKLPESNAIALSMPFTSPTPYGLGRSGWVTATFASPAQLPMPLLLSWLYESYRAIAPKRLSAALPPQAFELHARMKPAPATSRRRSSAPRPRPK
jgi:predicted DNA-binding protein (MmcQ/YjbR family)